MLKTFVRKVKVLIIKMQIYNKIMISQYRQLVYEAILHIYRIKTIPTFFFLFYYYLKINSVDLLLIYSLFIILIVFEIVGLFVFINIQLL